MCLELNSLHQCNTVAANETLKERKQQVKSIVESGKESL